MLLRVSSETRGEAVDLQAVTDAAASSGVPHGEELTAFAEACVRGDENDVAVTRAALRDAMGPEALVDAAGVVGNFQRMVRIADGTGIPLDRPVAVFSVDMREDLGIDDFGHAQETPIVNGFLRFIGRVTQPLVRTIMGRYAVQRAPDQENRER
jgi:hypothetical protein